jgi:hypothetical protein
MHVDSANEAARPLTARTPWPCSCHLRRAVDLAAPADNRLVAGLAEVSLATLHARHSDPAAALRCQRVIPQWRQAGAWTRATAGA